ncbi:sodium-coupled monocarboxylate transporter 1-like [Mizuhopecten yessoensis]|uniref:sodium-coupled monocarboxylate transporter 1-like n=1 Tax=Mizuhopecten yessoensis TaxID=6573 RepID=UPI000B458D4E|nr:sodium-coupled monocarboxylate transporter 1-like [Mizuhopecten yessoensis]
MSGSIVQLALSVFGACGGPLAGLFYLGGMVPKANWIGAFSGSLTAIVFNMWIAVGSQIYGAKPVKLIQNRTSGCFLNNFTVTTNEPSMFNHNASINTTPYGVFGPSSMSVNSQVSSDEGFFLYNLSYTWYGFIGFFLTLILGVIVSLFTGMYKTRQEKRNFLL